MLPESMAKEFDPESDSAEDIEEAILSLVEKQVRLMLPNNDGNVADEEDDEEAEVVSEEEAPAKATRHVSLGRKFHKK